MAKNGTDPCNKLKFDVDKKEERKFNTSEGDVVCRKDHDDQQYRMLALLDDDQPLAINYEFLKKLKNQEKVQKK